MSTIAEQQTYKRIPTLDMAKKATGINIEELEAMLSKMDDRLTTAHEEAVAFAAIADTAFDKIDGVYPGSPDNQDGYMELTDLEFKAEQEKANELEAYHRRVENVATALHNMKDALKRLI